jgi:hypothetical protein
MIIFQLRVAPTTRVNHREDFIGTDSVTYREGIWVMQLSLPDQEADCACITAQPSISFSSRAIKKFMEAWPTILALSEQHVSKLHMKEFRN